MLSKNKKRAILIVIDMIFSAYIWRVNALWGNDFTTCLILSTTTFLIVFTPFEIYWSIRDIWFDRWMPLYLNNIQVSKIKIEVDGGFLSANLVMHVDQKLIETKNAVIIICHGFSDTKEKLQYYYFPLAYHGYVILSYDARGTGESKNTGKRSDFLKRIEDYYKIVEWTRNHDYLKQMKIYSVGFSIGATTVLCGGFNNKYVEKIIAVSSMSHYDQNVPRLNPLIAFSYFMKGVKMFPNDEENRNLSPYLIIESVKRNISKEEWQKFAKKVLLIHAKNDRIIKFKNFKENKFILELKDENQLILRKGGHIQKKNELALVGASLRFFNSK